MYNANPERYCGKKSGIVTHLDISNTISQYIPVVAIFPHKATILQQHL